MRSEIDPKELNVLLSEEKYVLLDVREKWEYDEDRILDCINIPLHDLPFRLDEIEAIKHKHLIVYCRSGKRGSQARKYLTLNGFSMVSNLAGGMEAYQMQLSLTP